MLGITIGNTHGHMFTLCLLCCWVVGDFNPTLHSHVLEFGKAHEKLNNECEACGIEDSDGGGRMVETMRYHTG